MGLLRGRTGFLRVSGPGLALALSLRPLFSHYCLINSIST